MPRRQVVRMGNKATGGPFAPLVAVVRNVVGEKDFNKLRGKAISLHSQGADVLHPPVAAGGLGVPAGKHALFVISLVNSILCLSCFL